MKCNYFIEGYQKTIQQPNYEDCGVNWLAETERGKYMLKNCKKVLGDP